MSETLNDQYFADLFQGQAEHWRACYHRLLGKKLEEGKVVRGHVATPPDVVAELARCRKSLAGLLKAVSEDGSKEAIMLAAAEAERVLGEEFKNA